MIPSGHIGSLMMKTKHFVLHPNYWVWDFQGYGACQHATALLVCFGAWSDLAEFCSFYYVFPFYRCIQRCIDVVYIHSTLQDLFLSTELLYMPSPFRTGRCKCNLAQLNNLPCTMPVDWCTNAPAAGANYRGCCLPSFISSRSLLWEHREP